MLGLTHGLKCKREGGTAEAGVLGVGSRGLQVGLVSATSLLCDLSTPLQGLAGMLV